jgi:hypothetical protein
MQAAHTQARRKEREEQAGGVGLHGDASPLAPARAALGAVPGRLSRGVRAPQRPAVPAAAAGGLGARRLMGRAAPPGGGKTSALEVFVDDEFGERPDGGSLHGGRQL